MLTGIELIKAERKEQQEKHGFTLEHDKAYINGELKQAAEFCLVVAGFDEYKELVVTWPEKWDKSFEEKIKAKTKIEQLVIAGALFMAESERSEGFNYWSWVQRIATAIDRMQAEDASDDLNLVYELDFGDTNLLTTEIKGILDWMEADLQNLKHGDSLEYTITTRMMTSKEIEEIPEWS